MTAEAMAILARYERAVRIEADCRERLAASGRDDADIENAIQSWTEERMDAWAAYCDLLGDDS